MNIEQNIYGAIYKGNEITVEAGTSYEAQRKAAALFHVKPGQEYKVTVMLTEKAGQPVTHVADF